MKSKLPLTMAALLACLPLTLSAQVPQLLNYQGRVAVGAVNFQGSGQFRFALVNAAGNVTYWSNDGTSVNGSQPAAAVTLAVTKGLYSVQLGDTSLANMTAIPNNVFNNADVRVRVWFNDGVNGTELLSPDQRISSVGYAMIAGTVPDGAVTGAKLANGAVTSAKLASGSVGAAQLAAGAAAANLNASGQSAVPAGGIVLSAADNPALVSAGYVKVGTVNTSDGWEQRSSVGAPSARQGHCTVWTGTQMIVWGGKSASGWHNDGGRYVPATGSWLPLTPPGSLLGRIEHTAVWTGTEMIIWGGAGSFGYQNNGARYNPATDTWTPMSSVGAPSARTRHTAVWTGTEMIVWGGQSAVDIVEKTGARYKPSTNTWTALPAPAAGLDARHLHSAVWTGTEMIVWGGEFLFRPLPGIFDPPGTIKPVEYVLLADGARYEPATDTWTMWGAPNTPAARRGHSAVWSGMDMIVWGGEDANGPANTGAAYRTATNAWALMGSSGAPAPRVQHSTAWTGTQMIVWGGYDVEGNVYSRHQDGGLFNPVTGAWADVTTTGAPGTRAGHSGIWTGSELLIWGGSSAGTYLNDLWSYTTGRSMVLYQRP